MTHRRWKLGALATAGVVLSLTLARVAVALLGDVNTDGAVNDTDAQQVLDAVVGRRTFTPSQMADADVDGDGDIDVGDAQMIRQLAAGLLPAFPTRTPQASGPIATTRDGGLVGVVNPDSDSVSFVDTATDTLLAEVPVGREPVGVAFARDGLRAYVAEARDARLAVVDTTTFGVVGHIPVGVEPFGVVVNFRGDRAYVSNAASGTVSIVDLHSETVAATLVVPEKPQGLAVTADSAKVFVTHLNGHQVSVIDAQLLGVSTIPLAEPPFDALNPTVPAGKPNRMKGIAIHPTRAEAWVPHILSNSGNFVETLFNTTIFPAVGVLNTATNTEVPGSRMTLFAGLSTIISNPETVTFSPDGARAYVVSAASNDLTVLNATTRQEIGVLRDVGDNPRGIAVHPGGVKGYVFNRLTPAVSVVNLDTRTLVKTIPVSTDPLPPNIANGRRLFFTSAPPEVSQDRFFGCEACHFDGRDDGQTWFFTNGPRQTLSLAATTAHTGLLHHNGDRKDVQDFRFTFTRLQNGTGLSEDQLDDLADFVNTRIRIPENPFLNANLSRTTAARRGRRLFAAANCATCHAGPFLTDATDHNDPANPLLHDVGIFAEGSGTQDETDKTRDQDGIAADTVRPAGHFESTFLVGVWATAPYLHDGRAATLRDTLTVHNAGNQHGTTSGLSAAQLDDLVAYLQQLDITQSRVQITSPADGARVARLAEVSGNVLPEVTAVQVLVNGAGPIPAVVAGGRFTAAVPPGLVPALPRGAHFDVTALATTADGEPGRDDVEVEANFGVAADPVRGTVEASPALIPSDGVSTSLVTVTPRESGGGLVGTGLVVQVQTTRGTLGPVVDVGDGRYVALLTSESTPSVAVVSARQSGGPLFTDTAQVRFAAGDVDAATSELTVAPGTLEASVAVHATATVVPRDALGIDLGPGQTVVITVDRGTLGPVTDNDGVYTATYTPPTAPGLATFHATVNGTALTAAPTVTLVADVTPPPAPDLSRVTFATPSGGASKATGGAGTVEPLATVRLQNVTTGAAVVQTAAASDGSFSANVPLASNQNVCVRAVDAAGNQSPQACIVPFPVSVPTVHGVLRRAAAAGGFTPVAGAQVELDVATVTDPPTFTPVFAGGGFLRATTAADGTFQIVLPAGLTPDPSWAVVTLADPLTFALVNDIERTVIVDAISSALVPMMVLNDQLLGNVTAFPATNFTPAERVAIENALRPATTEVSFFGLDPIDAIQPIADDVFFDADGPKDFLDLTAFETFKMAAESPGTGPEPVVVRGRLTIPGTSGPRPLAGVSVDLATLSFSGCGFSTCVSPIAGASGVTNAAGEYSLTLPGFVAPGSSTVIILIGDLLYGPTGLPGPFDSGAGVFSIGSFVTDTTANVDLDLAGRIGMQLIALSGAPIENFSPTELDQLLALLRLRLAATPLTLANKTLQQVFVAAFNAMAGDTQVAALVNAIKDAESGDNSHVTANPTTLEADGVSRSTITVEPLGPTSERVGPGLLVELTTTLGTITTPAIDNHDGTYTAFLRAPTTPGTATVTAKVEGTILGEKPSVTFTPDVTVPTPPAGGRVVFVGAGPSTVTVIGLPGSVEAGSTVTIQNSTLGTTVTVHASDDGSFRADITASAGQSLSLRTTDGSSNVSGPTALVVGSGIALPAIINPGALPGGVTPVFGPLAAGGLGTAVPAGFTFLGGFTLDLADKTASAPLEVLFPASAPVPAGKSLLLVQAISVRSGTELRVVAPAIAAGGLFFPRPGAAFPGVREGGRYAVLAADAAQAFLAGTVTGSRGAVQGVHMTLGPSPFTDLTRADGGYLLAGPLGGGQTLAAALQIHEAPAQMTARLPFAGAVTDCDFTLTTRANVSFAFTGRFAAVGQVARRMALTPAGDKLYVALTLRGDLQLLDAATLAAGSLIEDAGPLNDLAFTPNGATAFLAFGNRVRDFTVDIEEPGRVIAAVGFPRDAAVTPNGDLALLASSLDNTEGDVTPDALFPLDPFTNQVGAAIPVDADPAAVAVNSASTRAYVVSKTRGTLTVINVPGRSVLRTVTLGGSLVDVAVKRGGAELYVADATGNTVKVLDAALAEDAVAGNEVLATIPVGAGPTGLALTPDGARLLVSEQQDDTVSVITLATRSVTAVWATVDLPAAVAVHPNGKTAYVLDPQTQRGVLAVPLAASDTTPPSVVDVGPKDRVGILLQDSPIEVVFSERLDPATVTLANLQVKDAGGNPIAGTLAPAGGGVAALFTPGAGVRYALNSTVKLSLTGALRDVAGLALPAEDRTIPTVAMQLPDLPKIALDLSPAGVAADGSAGAVHPGCTVDVTNQRTGVVFRTTAAGNGSFHLPLTGLDTDGYQLVTSLFGGRARTNPVPVVPNFTIDLPDPARVSYAPGPAGTLRAVGAAGAVDPKASRVRIRDLTSGQSFETTAVGADGSFSLGIFAARGDALELVCTILGVITLDPVALPSPNLEPPAIDFVTPNRFVFGNPVTLNVVGRNFGTVPGDIKLEVDGVVRTDFVLDTVNGSPSQRALVVGLAVGADTGEARVTVGGQTSNAVGFFAETPANTSPFAEEVIASSVAGDPSDVLGEADADFTDLGPGGSITVRLGSTVEDGPGNDLQVFEDGSDGNDCYEVLVSASSVGPFDSLGEVCGTAFVNLNGHGPIRFVRLVDADDGGPSARIGSLFAIRVKLSLSVTVEDTTGETGAGGRPRTGGGTPALQEVNATPSAADTAVCVNKTTTLNVNVTPPPQGGGGYGGGCSDSITWSPSGGSVNPPNGAATTFTAPGNAGTVNVTVTVTRSGNCAATGTDTKQVSIDVAKVSVTGATMNPVTLGEDMTINYMIDPPVAFDSADLEIKNKNDAVVFKKSGLATGTGAQTTKWEKAKWSEAPNAGFFANPKNGPYKLKILGKVKGKPCDSDPFDANTKLIIEADVKDKVAMGAAAARSAGLDDLLDALKIVMKKGSAETVVSGAGAITVTGAMADEKHIKVDSPSLNSLDDGTYEILFRDLRDGVGNFADMDNNPANGAQPLKFNLELR